MLLHSITMKGFQAHKASLCVFLCFLFLVPQRFATPCDGGTSKKHHLHPPANQQRALSLRAGSSSSSSSSYSLGLQSYRHNSDNKPSASPTTKNQSSSSTAAANHQNPIGISAIAALSTNGGRKACGLYVWDFPSAIFYRWCHHLLKDSVYEGRGGRKFVRIEPGSMLQLLYPCSRYSPDRCLLCGGTFRDHLELWWSKKNLYNPFDLLVDKVFQQGLHVQKEQVIKSKRRKGTSVAIVVKPEEVDYVYHRRYVLDLGEKLQGIDNPKERQKMLKKIATENAVLSGQIERRKVRLGREKVDYVVPASTSSTSKPSMSFILFRAILLRAVDNLIEVEMLEKQKNKASR